MNIKIGNNIITYNMLSGLFLLILLGIALFDWLTPRPALLVEQKKIETQKEKALLDKEKTLKELTQTKAHLANKTYTGSVEQISPIVLQKVTALAASHNFEIASFRPQKPVENGTVNQVTFAITGHSSFLDVVKMVSAIEDTMPKLTLSEVQITSADSATDAISATIDVTAFLAKSPVKKEAQTRGKA